VKEKRPLKRWKHQETAIMATLKSNVKIKCDTGLNGRLTSTFGWFGYDLNQVCQQNSLILDS